MLEHIWNTCFRAKSWREHTFGTHVSHRLLYALQRYRMVFVLNKSDQSISRKRIEENHPFWINFPLLPYRKNLRVKYLVNTRWSFPHDRIELHGQPKVHSVGNCLLHNANQCSRSCFDGRNWSIYRKVSQKGKNNPIKNQLNNQHSGTWNWYGWILL